MTNKWSYTYTVSKNVIETEMLSANLILFYLPFHVLFSVMDTQAVFAALYGVCEENVAFFSGGAKGTQGDAGRRLVEAMKLIQEHARSLEPVISGFTAVYQHFDFDPHIPANGYRSLVKVSCAKL